MPVAADPPRLPLPSLRPLFTGPGFPLRRSRSPRPPPLPISPDSPASRVSAPSSAFAHPAEDNALPSHSARHSRRSIAPSPWPFLSRSLSFDQLDSLVPGRSASSQRQRPDAARRRASTSAVCTYPPTSAVAPISGLSDQHPCPWPRAANPSAPSASSLVPPADTAVPPCSVDCPPIVARARSPPPPPSRSAHHPCGPPASSVGSTAYTSPTTQHQPEFHASIAPPPAAPTLGRPTPHPPLLPTFGLSMPPRDGSLRPVDPQALHQHPAGNPPPGYRVDVPPSVLTDVDSRPLNLHSVPRQAGTTGTLLSHAPPIPFHAPPMSYHLPPNPFSVPPMPFHPPPTPFYAQPMLPRHTDAPLPGAMINVWAPGATLHLGGTASAGSSVLDDRSRGAQSRSGIALPHSREHHTSARRDDERIGPVPTLPFPLPAHAAWDRGPAAGRDRDEQSLPSPARQRVYSPDHLRPRQPRRLRSFEAQYARSDGTMLGPDAPIDLLAPPLRERLSNRGCIVAFGLPRECVRARDAFVWLMSAARCRGYQGGGPALLAGATADEAGGLVKNGYVVAAFEHQSDAKAILLAFRSPSQTDDTDLPDLPDPASSVYPIVTSARYQPEWRVGMLVPWHTALSVYRPGNAETDPLSTTPPSSGTHEKAQIHHLSQEPRRAAGPIALDTPPPSPEQLR